MLSLTKKISLLMVAVLMVGAVANAQEKKWDKYPYPEPKEEEYKEYVPEKRKDQQDKFLDNKYTHPAKPKHKTEIGLDLGSLYVNGDVHPDGKVLGLLPGYGLGLHIRRSLGYLFSIRLSGMGGTAFGQNWEPNFGFDEESTRNPALTGNIGIDEQPSIYEEFNDDPTPNYSSRVPNEDGTFGNGYVYYNYRTRIREITASGIINLNNIQFHKRRNWVGANLYFGFGGMVYNTKMNQLDENNNDYNDLYKEVIEGADQGVWENRKELLRELKDGMDNTYESQAEIHTDDIFGLLGDKWNFVPTVHGGMGLSFKLSPQINLGIDSKITLTRDDLLDGQRYQEGGAVSRDFDTFQFTSANLNINLGGDKSIEPLWWMSPLDYAYSELRNISNIEIPPPYELKDADGDGVPDEFDDEPGTLEGCTVNTRGVALDSDGDGVIDCEDKQPFTAYDLVGEVDKDGVAEREIVMPECNCPEPIAPPAPCDWFLPMIHFDLDKDNLKPEFYPHLHHVATAMKACPEMNIAVVGHTDTRADDEYNNKLSCRRAQAAIDYLVSNYGIDRYRFTKSFQGETSNLVKDANKDGEHYLNRRVEFLTGAAAANYYDLGPCPGEDGNVDPNSGISSDSYYGTGGNSIFIDK